MISRPSGTARRRTHDARELDGGRPRHPPHSHTPLLTAGRHIKVRNDPSPSLPCYIGLVACSPLPSALARPSFPPPPSPSPTGRPSPHRSHIRILVHAPPPPPVVDATRRQVIELPRPPTDGGLARRRHRRRRGGEREREREREHAHIIVPLHTLVCVCVCVYVYSTSTADHG